LVTAFYALYVILILQLGIRRPLLGLLPPSLAAWHYLVKRISFKKAVTITLVLGVANSEDSIVEGYRG
jgi:hypothetical protein